MRTSAMCEYCHSQGERVVGKQTQTFLEWRDDFSKAGLGSQQCQDCQMPRTVRKLADNFEVTARPAARYPWTGPTTRHFWKPTRRDRNLWRNGRRRAWRVRLTCRKTGA